MINAPNELMAIVSNGPSAARNLGAIPFGATIAAVTTAIHRRRADWWVFNDAETYLEHRAQVRPAPDGLPPKIFTRLRTATSIKTLGSEFRPGERILWHEDVAPLSWPSELRAWNQWSGLSAFALALHLRPIKLWLVGYDLAGAGDCIGSENGSRSEERWEAERAAMNHWLVRLRGAGIEVQRVE